MGAVAGRSTRSLGAIKVTLLTTEIHRGADGDIVVFAADQRITRGLQCDGNRPKIFRLPGRLAGIGYFGLAEVRTGSSTQPMSEWIRDFFYHLQANDSLRAIAEQLVAHLNTDVPKAWRDKEASGFHLAGLDASGRAEFWYIRNIDDTGILTQTDYQLREDFKSRDALVLPAGAAQIYRNGDIRAHVAAWGKIDESFGALLGTPSFRALSDINDYVDWVKFKLEVVASFYERFATESIIGHPVDAFAIHHGA